MLVNHFIFGINLKSKQKALLKEGNDLMIASALKVAEMNEAMTRQLEAIRAQAETMTMYAIKNKNARKSRHWYGP